MSKESALLPSARKKMRNQEIFMDFAAGVTKQEICSKWNLSLTQLNRILREAEDESEEWFKSLPHKTMVQIFRHNSEKIFEEIQRLTQIRNKIQDPAKEFEMTRAIIVAYSQYTKTLAEGPSVIRQKQVTEQAEKIIGEK